MTWCTIHCRELTKLMCSNGSLKLVTLNAINDEGDDLLIYMQQSYGFFLFQFYDDYVHPSFYI
jgi:hypothetical protein